MCKKLLLCLLSFLLVFGLCACSTQGDTPTAPTPQKIDVVIGLDKPEEGAQDAPKDNGSAPADAPSDGETGEETVEETVEVVVGQTVLTATLEDNSSARAFAELLRRGELTISMRDYGNFEKVGDLPKALERNDERITTAPGDIILYQGNQITIYYDTNTWSFTRLGRIDGATKESLLALLGKGDVTVTFRLSKEQSAATGKVLVACFSATGRTAQIAEQIKHLTNADLYEILPAVPYTAADLAYYTDCRADREQSDPAARPTINGSVADMASYDVIFLGYPIWHGQAPRIISTFLESYDLSGKTIIPFCTSGSSGIGNSDTALHALAPHADWRAGRRFASGTGEQALSDWLKSLSLPAAHGPEED